LVFRMALVQLDSQSDVGLRGERVLSVIQGHGALRQVREGDGSRHVLPAAQKVERSLARAVRFLSPGNRQSGDGGKKTGYRPGPQGRTAG